MERDGSSTAKAEIDPVEKGQSRDVVAAAPDVQAQDFSESQPSQDHALQELVSQDPRGKEKEAQTAIGLGPTAGTAVVDDEPGFVDVNGDVGGPGHNETEVDIIAVACPGADPVNTWIYDHDSDYDHGISSDIGSRGSAWRSSPWVTRDLRSTVSIARVFLYRHRALSEGVNLKTLSEDLLVQLHKQRRGAQSRPLFFIAHSIGGLVVKSALVRASQSSKYQSIMDNCHGVSFFGEPVTNAKGTPHRGTSYMSMLNLKESIQELLHLQAALPQTLTDEIHLNSEPLTRLHEKFVDMASELRLWSFYETQESSLSGSGDASEVQFGAPLVSVKSALLDIWQEDVYAVDSDHAHLASFGPGNRGILASYLDDLAGAVRKAAALSRAFTHVPLHLKDRVKVEIIGFYEDPDALMASALGFAQQSSNDETSSMIRLYSTKHPFREFVRIGPDACLEERLHRPPERKRSRRRARREPERSPEIVVTSPLERPALLKVPAQSDPTIRPPSPESITSVSTTVSDPALPYGSAHGGTDHHGIDLSPKRRAEILINEHELRGPAGFSRPNPQSRKFTWIHLPFNNPVWVRELFDTLEGTQKAQNWDFSRLFDYDNWASKQIQNRNSDSQPAYLKPICKYLSATDRGASPRIPSPLFGPAAPLKFTPNCLYLYLPYLHFDTYRSMIRRRKLIRDRRNHGRAKPVPQEVADQDSLELKMIWEYIGYDPPLNCRRTLDQFGHHSLRDTDSRDDDQMLYKLTKKDSPLPWSKSLDNSSTRSLLGTKGSDFDSRDGSNEDLRRESELELRDGYVLMVDQLWLWSIDTTTLTTCFGKRESSPTEGTLFQQADLRNSVYNELNGDLTGRTENTLDLAALIVWHAVIVLLDRSSHPDLEIFRLFDEAIGMLAERMTLNMKQFRIHALNLVSEDDEEESDESGAEGESPAAIKKRHRREIERAERENRENTSALLELRDLEDELTTLQKLFETQEGTIKQMREIYKKEFNYITKNGQYYLEEALEYLDDYKQQTSEMLKRVDTTRNDYEKMLEMVQRQAQVDEVRWSRLQAELASSQNLSVMIFTTFTVIFLPLTFFTGLFGMNTIEWQEENIPSLREIGAISLPASVLLIVLSLVAAFNWRMQTMVKRVYKGLKTSWKVVKAVYLKRLEPESRKEAKRRRRNEKKRRKAAELKEKNDQAYDFWAMVKKQQSDMSYQIPDQNVNNTASGGDLASRKRV
ncbi:Protein SERAC1 [Madurella mycetomatis]|uniref:Protein SERAC1 n=1 Tax=Madurella mycetomatis TaxID=100816 RepID=A0A175VTR8_9PEZI|nr:Protein SERAC1 [Madurella mycetomatis]